MEATDRFIGFFRFRSPARRIIKLGDPDNLWFIIQLIRLFDVSREVILLESIFIGQMTSGAITYKDLLELYYSDYDTLLKAVIDLRTKKPKNKGDADG